MKFILCFIFMLISAKECDSKTAQKSTNTTSEVTALQSKKTSQIDTKITYQASTRGFFLKIWIEGDLIMVSKDNSLKSFETYPFPSEQKEAFLNLLSAIDKTELTTLETPSTTFQHDAAAMAWLEISDEEGSYRTKVFDHGNPPESIKEIVEKIQSLKSMVEKP
ncbi:hypothetical protein [Psychroserpens algicola]|uniref:DUF4488 domain-containing protein n=1 Tax=Psychroserpens algicola TaxID=1719034 RepID=A0ABT0H7G2_9FLAO|nr:hypothetical protein [Psychroserpens algicola]MCK8480291.1 hypothetical protein [Psychroserpens algicola]